MPDHQLVQKLLLGDFVFLGPAAPATAAAFQFLLDVGAQEARLADLRIIREVAVGGWRREQQHHLKESHSL